MLLNFTNEVPYLRAAFRVLKTEGVVDTIGLSPNNERICIEEGLSAQTQWGSERSHTNLAVFDRRRSSEWRWIRLCRYNFVLNGLLEELRLSPPGTGRSKKQFLGPPISRLLVHTPIRR
jgi:hypothetical protein